MISTMIFILLSLLLKHPYCKNIIVNMVSIFVDFLFNHYSKSDIEKKNAAKIWVGLIVKWTKIVIYKEEISWLSTSNQSIYALIHVAGF